MIWSAGHVMGVLISGSWGVFFYLCHTHFSPQQKHDLLRHTARVMAIDWSPDCTKLVSGSIDTSICIWQIPSGDCVQLKGVPMPSVPGHFISALFY